MIDLNKEFDKIVKKYNYEYNYFDGYCYDSKNLSSITKHKNTITICFGNDIFKNINTLKEFENIIKL